MSESRSKREALTLECHGATLVGVLERPAGPADTGVLIVVGGPQYRVGSHRQFLSLARRLAGSGIAVLRFDHRGIGDSEGEARPFYTLNDDIRVALDGFIRHCPTVKRFVIWGLCDGAAAALLYANTDPRVAGLILLNPWLDSPEAQARSLITHYYRRRLFSTTFWTSLFRGEVKLRDTLRELGANFFLLLGGSVRPGADGPADSQGPLLVESLAAALAAFPGEVLVFLSGADLTAATFEAAVKRSPVWQAAMNSSRVSKRRIADADHTFSRADWSQTVELGTLDWISRLDREIGRKDSQALSQAAR
jgi:exosortase A-associated hydrolase 1